MVMAHIIGLYGQVSPGATAFLYPPEGSVSAHSWLDWSVLEACAPRGEGTSAGVRAYRILLRWRSIIDWGRQIGAVQSFRL